MPASLLIGLLVMDLVGFLPGVSVLTSVACAAVLVVLDPRGLVTLNGLIKWRRMSFRMKAVAVFLELALFQFLVLVYVVQRLYALVKRRAVGAFTPATIEPIHDSDLLAGSAIPLDADGIRLALRSVLAEAERRLPRDLLDKVRLVVGAMDEVLPAYRASNLVPHDRFVIERTAGDYLPSAVRTYLDLPEAFRSIPLPGADGKTAGQVLSEELDLLVQRVREVADGAYRKEVEALLVHRRFLRSKFGRSGLTIDS